MTPDRIIDFASNFAILILVVAMLLTVWRAVVGPTLPDRVVALDMLVGIVIGFIAVIALKTGYTLYIDIAISLGLVGFLATVAFARFILARGRVGEDQPGRAESAASSQILKREASKSVSKQKSGGKTGKPAGKTAGKGA
ncbi:cation:proton antiporter [Rhizobium sp. AAP43]|uniref:cation:proton antiporter n=1 Tax=Rhizobium sp. AAP43 TaxID=1523420 RepID=UPI0006B89A67|nr:cation:proton antiporter [Rhizobium sp. AAP43]KPF42284.1 sodium:proton antiporter [Rhizobium sp. AAP43]